MVLNIALYSTTYWKTILRWLAKETCTHFVSRDVSRSSHIINYPAIGSVECESVVSLRENKKCHARQGNVTFTPSIKDNVRWCVETIPTHMCTVYSVQVKGIVQTLHTTDIQYPALARTWEFQQDLSALRLREELVPWDVMDKAWDLYRHSWRPP